LSKKTRNTRPRKDCLKCEKSYTIGNYYTADKKLFPDGKLHICKKCCADIMDESHEGFLSILRLINKPFLPSIFKGDTGDYIRQVNSLHQYDGMTYSDSNFGEINEEDVLDDLDIDNEVKMRWVGYEDLKDINFLEEFYKELISTYESKTPMQRNIYKNMAETQLLANKSRAQGKIKEYQDLLKTMSTLMTDAKIKPLQDSGEQDGGLSTWGQWIKKIEETEPIPEPLEEFRDVDGINKYISKWFTKHLKKVFGVEDNNAIDMDEIIKNNGDS